MQRCHPKNLGTCLSLPMLVAFLWLFASTYLDCVVQARTQDVSSFLQTRVTHCGNSSAIILPDLGFNITAPLGLRNTTKYADTLVLSSLGIGIVRFILTPIVGTVFRRWFLILGFLFLLRTICIRATLLPNPDLSCVSPEITNIWIDAFRYLIGVERTCADVMFSGHTVNMSMSMLSIYWYCIQVPIFGSCGENRSTYDVMQSSLLTKTVALLVRRCPECDEPYAMAPPSPTREGPPASQYAVQAGAAKAHAVSYSGGPDGGGGGAAGALPALEAGSAGGAGADGPAAATPSRWGPNMMLSPVSLSRHVPHGFQRASELMLALNKNPYCMPEVLVTRVLTMSYIVLTCIIIVSTGLHYSVDVIVALGLTIFCFNAYHNLLAELTFVLALDDVAACTPCVDGCPNKSKRDAAAQDYGTGGMCTPPRHKKREACKECRGGLPTVPRAWWMKILQWFEKDALDVLPPPADLCASCSEGREARPERGPRMHVLPAPMGGSGGNALQTPVSAAGGGGGAEPPRRGSATGPSLGMAGGGVGGPGARGVDGMDGDGVHGGRGGGAPRSGAWDASSSPPGSAGARTLPHGSGSSSALPVDTVTGAHPEAPLASGGAALAPPTPARLEDATSGAQPRGGIATAAAPASEGGAGSVSGSRVQGTPPRRESQRPAVSSDGVRLGMSKSPDVDPDSVELSPLGTLSDAPSRGALLSMSPSIRTSHSRAGMTSISAAPSGISAPPSSRTRASAGPVYGSAEDVEGVGEDDVSPPPRVRGVDEDGQQ